MLCAVEVLAGADWVLARRLGVEHLGKTLGQMEATLLRLVRSSSWRDGLKLTTVFRSAEPKVPASRMWRRRRIRDLYARLSSLQQARRLVGPLSRWHRSLALISPFFFRRDQTTTVISNADPFSTVAHLHLDRCSLAPKPDHPLHETWEQKRDRIRQLLVIPAILDDDSEEILTEVRNACALEVLPVELQALAVAEQGVTPATISRVGDWIGFSEVTAWGAESSRLGLTLEEEVRNCFRNLEGE